MKGVYDTHPVIVGCHDDDRAMTDYDMLGMGHGYASSISELQFKGTRSVAQPVLYFLDVHESIMR